MRRNAFTTSATILTAAILWHAGAGHENSARAQNGGDVKRRISYQNQRDLFYNYYAQPGPYYNTPAQIYVSPQPVPPNVGHTYATYQPFMPHEYMWRHQRSYYTYNPGAGWTRTNVRYGTCGNFGQGVWADWHYPMSNNIWAGHNSFYHPGLRF